MAVAVVPERFIGNFKCWRWLTLRAVWCWSGGNLLRLLVINGVIGCYILCSRCVLFVFGILKFNRENVNYDYKIENWLDNYRRS